MVLLRCAAVLLCSTLLIRYLPALAQPQEHAGPLHPGMDIQAADSLIRTTFREHRTERYEQASAAYLDLIAAAPTPLDSTATRITCRHLAQLAPVLPPALHPMTPESEAGECKLSRGRAEEIIAWWRSRDPLPSTGINEHITEHLERVAEAERRFADDSRAGFDDRGAIFVRLGEPTSITPIELPPDIATLVPAGTEISNEYWTYARLGQYARYLFVSRKGHYELGSFTDLLPPHLQYGLFAPSKFGTEKAKLAFLLFRTYYRELSEINVEYGARLNRLVSYGDKPGASLREFLSGEAYPEAFREEDRLREMRAEAVPLSWSVLAHEATSLRVEARVVRFLEPDGGTRVEVYWAPVPGALAPNETEEAWLAAQGHPSNVFALSNTLVQYSSDYTRQHEVQGHLAVQGMALEREGTIPTQAAHTSGDSSMFSLALEVEQRALSTDSSRGIDLGVPFRRTIIRFDSLRALSSIDGVLEVSDIRPLYVPRSLELSSLQASTPQEWLHITYPFKKIRSGTQLGLYFEVSGLAQDAQGGTRYSVELEVYRRAEAGGLMRLFGRDRSEQTQVLTMSEGARTRVARLLLVDLEEYDLSPGELVLTVRVRDEVSSQKKERSLSFEVM